MPDPRIGNKSAQKWPPEHDEALRRHLDSGLSCQRAADALNREFRAGYTRNAVIGRAGRQGMMPVKEPGKPKVVKERVLTHPRGTGGAPRVRKPTPKPEPEVIALRCAEVVSRDVGLMDLAPGDCRYPYGGGPYLFCGQPKIEGQPYCEPHFQLCRGHMR